ncbi:DUF6630 family protein [Hymenobacter psychrophilus]|uniref:DUF6630 domain-containing protein n=1 Tax=Hymenobacter psychrophilus TaxID=651662 RepID=A0A1H3E7F9_9BACT|nr:DUF6630 family protein [Hymenobacter psychrophilus]SDX74702.1 hypothetical protein SAMN04488069_10315 [Hymenobacter psychrophilus]
MHPELSAFLDLFTLGDAAATQRLADRLNLVLTDATGYAAQFAEELAERGIESEIASQELRDIALIDALLAEDLAVECDWKETAGEIIGSLNYVLTRQKRPPLTETTDLGADEDLGPEQLDLVQEALEPRELALVMFSLDGDSYPLSVVAQEVAEDLAARAQQLGFKLHQW